MRRNTTDQASHYWLSRGSQTSGPALARKGLVRANYKIVYDDDGIFHPLGLTWFPGIYMLKHERSRLMAHLKWFATKRFDYLRSLGECDWVGRSWGPTEPDYFELLPEYVDLVYDHGMRLELTLVGGRQTDPETGRPRFIPSTFALRVADVLRSRAHKIMHYECANEWNRLDKVSMQDLERMGTVLGMATPNLVALSAPSGEREHAHLSAEEYETLMLAEEKPTQYSGYDDMIQATKRAGCSAFTIHPRRSSHDYGWSHVRQGYDFKDFPGATKNNEPEGPQSSVVSMTNPLQLACCRLEGIMCGGASYVLHVGQGVTGTIDTNHGRPMNMWEVDNIDNIIDAVRGCDDLMPPGVENWKCVNNGRSDHPLPLDGRDGFWESSGGNDRAPAVNKNYAAVSEREFRVMLTGVRSQGTVGPVSATKGAHRRCHVEAWHPVTRRVVAEANLATGESWTVPGQSDTMVAYVVKGWYL